MWPMWLRSCDPRESGEPRDYSQVATPGGFKFCNYQTPSSKHLWFAIQIFVQLPNWNLNERTKLVVGGLESISQLLFLLVFNKNVFTCCVYQSWDQQEGEEHKKYCHKFPRAPETENGGRSEMFVDCANTLTEHQLSVYLTSCWCQTLGGSYLSGWSRIGLRRQAASLSLVKVVVIVIMKMVMVNIMVVMMAEMRIATSIVHWSMGGWVENPCELPVWATVVWQGWPGGENIRHNLQIIWSWLSSSGGHLSYSRFDLS